MTTLATLKAKIAGDLTRSNLTTEIAEEIDIAITHYQSTRFYFSESRSETFASVASQVWYSASDNASIGNVLKIDDVFITQSGTRRALDYTPVTEFELLTDQNSASGEPYFYTRYAEQIGLYPIPEQAYTVRITGLFKVAAPESDDEANNKWMTEAYDLLRSRVKAQLYRHKIKDMGLADQYEREEGRAYRELLRKTSKQISSGYVRPTEF